MFQLDDVSRVGRNSLTYLLLVVGAAVAIAPVAWMISISLQSPGLAHRLPPQLFPNPAQWKNYLDAWQAANFSRYFLNSAGVAIAVTLGQLVTGSLAAYAFARMKFRGQSLLFYAVLGTLMIPSEMLLVPNYVILKSLGWLNSYAALTVPFMASAFSIFILRQHFKTVPQELEDAATLDGCSRLRFLVSIVLPLAAPALTVVAVFTFINNWNSYIWPLVVTRDDNLRTIQVGLSALKDAQTSGANTNWPLLMAASTMTLLPILILYIFGQRWFTQGHMLSGIKG